jgi:rsbT antagonist protein RsbS
MTQVPILRQGQVLIASIQGSLTDGDMLEFRDQVLEDLTRLGANGVIIDISVLDVLDSFATRTLCDLACAVQLRGARTVVVGIQPEVALAMVLLGLTLRKVPTALNLDAGLELLRRKDQSTDV